MRQDEQELISEAVSTLDRVRKVQVRFKATWTRLDDLEPGAERALTESLTAIWELWAQEHGVTDAQVPEPEVTVTKADYWTLTGDLTPGL